MNRRAPISSKPHPFTGAAVCCRGVGALLCLVLLGTHLLAAAPPSLALTQSAEAPPIASLSQIRALSVSDASKAMPVAVRGIVVGIEPEGLRHCFIHDGQEGCFVKILRVINGRNVTPGDEIELVGVTDPLGFYPSIQQAEVRILGRKPLPTPKRLQVDEIFSAKLDSEWVEVPAVVIGSESGDGRQTLTVEVYGNQFKAELPWSVRAAERTAELMQRKVLLRGVMGTIFNQDKQMTDRHFFLSSLDALTPLSPQPAGMVLPQVRISELLTGHMGPETAVRVIGVVTQADPRGFFLRDESGSTLVHHISASSLQTGMRVEVSGYGAVAPFRPVIRATRVELLGLASPLPEPVRVELGDPNVSHLHSEWIQIEAEYQGIVKSLHEEILQVRAQGRYFEASIPHLPRSGTVSELPLQVGDRVRLTGIYELTTTHALPRLNWVDGMRMHLASRAGIQLVASAPWWTKRRLFIACAAMTGIAALAMLTSWMLRRQVKRQMQVISEKLRLEAVGEERDRMARELHDTLEQQLSGVALQLDGLNHLWVKHPQEVPNALELARRMLRFTREEARRSVWDLRSQVLERDGLSAALRAIGAPFAHADGPEIVVSVTGDEHVLPPGHDFHLLRIAQEALTNAIKHGRAHSIRIELEYAEAFTRLRVVDDGVGFSAGQAQRPGRPSFGVMGMRERAAKIGAELTLNSTPGNGCELVVEVAQPSLA